jgi:hypothetical protein
MKGKDGIRTTTVEITTSDTDFGIATAALRRIGTTAIGMTHLKVSGGTTG